MLNDLDIYNKTLNKKILKSINKTVHENNFIFGKSVTTLEKKLSKLTKAKYVTTVGSGTDAIFLSLLSLDLKKNDEIIIPSFSWLSVLEVVLMLHLKPIFVDSNINDFNPNIDEIEKKINKKTKVVISNSLFGRSIDLVRLQKICKKRKITLIEDAAQNFGSKINKRDSCNISDISCTSFFPSKNVGCYGDGGAIFTNKKKISDKLKKLRNHGQKTYNQSNFIGISSRLGSMQASILIEKLKDLKNKKKKQKETYRQYVKFFEQNNITGFSEPRDKFDKYDDMNCQFSILVKKRKQLIRHLINNKINYKIYYSKPLYRQFNLKNKINLKCTEFICGKIISLPFNDISKKRFNLVLAKLQKIINKNKEIFFEKN